MKDKTTTEGECLYEDPGASDKLVYIIYQENLILISVLEKKLITKTTLFSPYLMIKYMQCFPPA